MKIEINLDSNNIGETVLDIFKNLKEEDKHQIALQVLKNYILEDPKIERAIEEDKILQTLKLDSYNKDKSDTELRNSYSFIDKCRSIQLSKEIMVKELTNAAITTYKQEIINLVKEDKVLQEAYDSIRKALIEDYPNMVKETMMQIVSNNFSTLFQTGMMQAYKLSQLEQNLEYLKTHGRLQ
jgi:hypothetical protein